MQLLDQIVPYVAIIGMFIGGIGGYFTLKEEVRQVISKIKENKEEAEHRHTENAKRLNRIEEANMINSNSNAELSAHISNLKEQFVDIKEELRAIRNLLEGFFREKK